MKTQHAHAQLVNLTPELFQTEVSALKHCRREAERLGDSPPAYALRAIADHAEQVLQALPELASKASLPVSSVGTAAGKLFSNLRDKALDLVIDQERSYRGTLLGVHHGVDLMTFIEQVAKQAEQPDLVAFCENWRSTREPLARDLEAGLSWFSLHPELAMRTVASAKAEASSQRS